MDPGEEHEGHKDEVARFAPFVRLAAAARLFAADRRADLPGRFTRAAADVAGDLVHFPLRAQVGVARRTPRDFLRDTLDLLSDSLDFLFCCLSAECWHPKSSLEGLIKQEPFPRGRPLDNPNPLLSRLSSQET